MLTAPSHLRGRMTRYTPQEIRDERIAWALARSAEGWTTPKIAAALGINSEVIREKMRAHGWRWWDQPRRIERRYRKRPGGEQ
ncbi:hypothetical protein [Paracoccus sp. SSJ]|uniref:hypothetical protein n=1 Tax=Paracoccus sp. SSJ TaxID=3050636 RepID=UPI002551AC9A|nr:hypothetical protein [Paracoccus sp. SSJ]